MLSRAREDGETASGGSLTAADSQLWKQPADITLPTCTGAPATVGNRAHPAATAAAITRIRRVAT